jgi:hypothetical protein
MPRRAATCYAALCQYGAIAQRSNTSDIDHLAQAHPDRRSSCRAAHRRGRLAEHQAPQRRRHTNGCKSPVRCAGLVAGGICAIQGASIKAPELTRRGICSRNKTIVIAPLAPAGRVRLCEICAGFCRFTLPACRERGPLDASNTGDALAPWPCAAPDACRAVTGIQQCESERQGTVAANFHRNAQRVGVRRPTARRHPPGTCA